VKAGVLPPASDSEAPTRLAAAFRERFQGDRQIAVDANMLLRLAKAIAYLRYSDENSNPRSLAQQLDNILERARRDGKFIPWEFVCADAAVT
jgi:hypothetical protein